MPEKDVKTVVRDIFEGKKRIYCSDGRKLDLHFLPIIVTDLSPLFSVLGWGGVAGMSLKRGEKERM